MTGAAHWCAARGPDLVLRVRVQPRSAPEGVAGLHAGRLRVRVNTPPVDGRANARLLQLLAQLLGVPAGSLELLRGHAGRDKDVLVRGAAAQLAAVQSALDPARPTR